MMRLIFLPPWILMLGVVSVQAQTSIRIGDELPAGDKEVEDTSGRDWSLIQISDSNGLLVIFSGNTCPWVAKWESRYNEISTMADFNNIGMIVLNSNERIRGRGESMGDMRRRAQKQGYNFPYALDEDHAIADAFGATRTPEVFLFDGDLKLVYHGAIDDNADDAGASKKKFLEDAINAISSGNEILIKETSVVGCSIKRTE